QRALPGPRRGQAPPGLRPAAAMLGEQGAERERARVADLRRR
ncbi:DeoR family transcriptional regulator, partial [Streptomyces nigra]